MSNVVLTDFWASWCGPCKIMHPVIEELEKEFAGKVEVRKIEMDNPDNQPTVDEYQVTAIPTYVVEKDGQVIDTFVGAQPKHHIVEALKKALE